MSSRIKIISDAVIKLGDDPVTTLDDGRTAAEAGDARYDGVIGALLTRHHWRFATKHATLSQLTGTAIEPWTYYYQVPSDCLMILRTYPTSNYAQFGDQIHSHVDDLEIEYIYKPSESKFPNYFVELAIAAMAAELAIPVTGARSLKQEMKQEMELALAHAFWADAQGSPPVAFVDSPLVNSRWTGYGGRSDS